MTVNDLIISTLKIGVIFFMLGVLVERLLIICGLARGNTIGLLIGAFFISFLKQLLDSGSSLWLYCLFISVIGPISVNRSDIVITIKKGRWWWKSEDDKKEP